jgi:hypothetical protein
VTLALDFEWQELLKVMLVTTLLEGGGRFAAINANTDHAGLSFGIIQWAQKPGRLTEILKSFQAADADAFTQTFGGGDTEVAAGLLAHTAKPHGGVDPNTDITTDAAFDLTDDTWKGRFGAAALLPQYQKAQVTTALGDFRSSLAKIQSYGPEFQTERAVAFMLDLAIQHADPGAQSIYQATKQDGQSVAEHLAAMVEESVRRMPDAFKAGTRARRELFLTTPLISQRR